MSLSNVSHAMIAGIAICLCAMASLPQAWAHVVVNGTAKTGLNFNISTPLMTSSSSSSSCAMGDNCYDMRLQNVKGCTNGWTLHGLWPQWAQSCTKEKFDINQLSDLADDLKNYWPSCQGSSQSFWEHEWSKHGTCSGMSQHDFFSKALSLCKAHRGQCNTANDGSCNVCFDKGLTTTVTCSQ